MNNPSDGKTALGLDTNVGAMLCYLPICGINLIYSIIVLVTDKTNKLVRFHAFQSLLLMGACLVGVFGIIFIGGALAAVTESVAIASLVGILYMAVIVAFIVAMIFGCVKGYQGHMFKLPVIGNMADNWSN